MGEGARDRFDLDRFHHHALPFEPSVPEIRQIARQLAGPVRAFRLWNRAIGLARLFAPIVSGVRGPVPGAALGNDTSRSASTSQPQHRLLARPFDRRIAQSGDADAAWQAAFDGSLHKSGCKEGERYRHVDLTYAAPLASGDAFDVRFCIIDKLVEPAASAGDRYD
jgi:hypothetical protein